MRKLLAILVLCAGLLATLTNVFADGGATGGGLDPGNLPTKHCYSAMASIPPGGSATVPGTSVSIKNNGSKSLQPGGSCDGCPGTEGAHNPHAMLSISSGSSVTITGWGGTDQMTVYSNTTIEIYGGPISNVNVVGKNVTMTVNAINGGSINVSNTATGTAAASNSPVPTPPLVFNLKGGQGFKVIAVTGNVVINS